MGAFFNLLFIFFSTETYYFSVILATATYFLKLSTPAESAGRVPSRLVNPLHHFHTPITCPITSSITHANILHDTALAQYLNFKFVMKFNENSLLQFLSESHYGYCVCSHRSCIRVWILSNLFYKVELRRTGILFNCTVTSKTF